MNAFGSLLVLGGSLSFTRVNSWNQTWGVVRSDLIIFYYLLYFILTSDLQLFYSESLDTSWFWPEIRPKVIWDQTWGDYILKSDLSWFCWDQIWGYSVLKSDLNYFYSEIRPEVILFINQTRTSSVLWSDRRRSSDLIISDLRWFYSEIRHKHILFWDQTWGDSVLTSDLILLYSEI